MIYENIIFTFLNDTNSTLRLKFLIKILYVQIKKKRLDESIKYSINFFNTTLNYTKTSEEINKNETP